MSNLSGSAKIRPKSLRLDEKHQEESCTLERTKAYFIEKEDNMNVLEDICPISEFRENAATLVAKVRTDNRPLIITQYGKSSAVLVSAESYQELLDKIQILSEIAESEAEIISGKGIEQDDFFNQLKDNYRK
jgi:prevent-host-death family protein